MKQLKKWYNRGTPSELCAVDQLNFTAKAGRVCAILGPNGSGKTTLLRMISTLLEPDEGAITVNGISTVKKPQLIRSRLGFLTGSASLHKNLTPRETLEFFGELYGMEKAFFHQRLDRLVAQLSLQEFYNKTIGKLSMGQKQRVMIARALLHDPAVIVFDEATTGLDVLAAKNLMDMIKQCRDAGKVVLFATHIMGEVSLLADDVLIMHRGQQCFFDTYEKLTAQQQADSIEEEFIQILERRENV